MANYTSKPPNEELLGIAEKILDSFLATFGSESNYLESAGELVSQEETERVFMDYINNLEFQDGLILNF